METTNHKLPTTNSKTLACVTTAKGTGAISSIRVAGPSAGAIIKNIFRPTSGGQTDFEIGDILTGNILDGPRVVDQVVVGCEGKNNFEINCHGNPIIVEIIMKLLKSHDAEPVDAGQMLAQQPSVHDVSNAIATEAKLAQLTAVTLEGVKIIANQVLFGIGKIAHQWLENMERLKLQDIAQQCEQILADSKTANLIITGCNVVIAGPVNSGKSTLLNCLAGRQKAIVTDTAGTTRDWVTGRCRTDRLLMELIDTAGLDENLPGANSIDGQSQRKAVELLTDCDLVLFVLDGSKTIRDEELKTKRDLLRGKKVLVVLNKLDLGITLNESKLNLDFAGCVSISAKSGERIKRLLKEIRKVLGVADFNLNAPVCFTQRQCDLLELLSQAKSKLQAKTVITDLLSAHAAVC
jgi:tRNA modification GTPase